MYIIAKIQKKIKMVEKNMIGIKVEKKKKKIFETTHEFSFTNPIEKRVSMQSIRRIQKNKKEKNRQNKNKANFSIFNQKEIKVTKTKH